MTIDELKELLNEYPGSWEVRNECDGFVVINPSRGNTDYFILPNSEDFNQLTFEDYHTELTKPNKILQDLVFEKSKK